MFEPLMLGIVQGVTEWLPVSSEGALLYVRALWAGDVGVAETIRLALFFHLGTVIAALVYFRRDVMKLLKVLLRFRDSSAGERAILVFLLIATLITGVVGVAFFVGISFSERALQLSGRSAGLVVGGLLLGVALFAIFASRRRAEKRESELTVADALLLGLAQGLAVLPGVSRSGVTVASLLLRGFDEQSSLRLSFLMSIPVALAGNIVLNLEHFSWSAEAFAGLAAAFALGLLTIRGLLTLTCHIPFSAFAASFGLLMIGSSFL